MKTQDTINKKDKEVEMDLGAEVEIEEANDAVQMAIKVICTAGLGGMALVLFRILASVAEAMSAMAIL